jgi:aryl-phospho-beta-D-glucosidase BglC (GH1 family)
MAWVKPLSTAFFGFIPICLVEGLAMQNPLLRLSVSGNQIVDSRGSPISLRGVCLGGWMNLENFIDGYPGSEHGLRAVMAEILGANKSRFFFDRLLDHFITEADIAFIKRQGATVVRIPLNYRHFEADSQPYHYLSEGFARLDRVLDWCTQQGLYAILDMHAVPGWQNPDWHSDNANRNALLWEHPHFQDRLIQLWNTIAERYRDRPAVAGYDLMNEPVTASPRGVFSEIGYQPAWPAINQLNRRLVEAIRGRDPDHIIFLEGDFFSSRFNGLEEPFAANLVYSGHNYSLSCFGPGPYPGEIRGERWDATRQQQAFNDHEGTVFTRRHQLPLWVGEFGAAYDGPAEEIPDRLRALDDQLAIFNSANTHWTTWTYKDTGVMGWVSLDPDCEYIQHLAHVLKAKRLLDTDFWIEWSAPTPAKRQAADLARLIADTIADPDLRLLEIETYFRQSSLANFVGELLQPAYAKSFLGRSEAEIDRILQSFRLENCCIHQDLIGIIHHHLTSPVART